MRFRMNLPLSGSWSPGQPWQGGVDQLRVELNLPMGGTPLGTFCFGPAWTFTSASWWTRRWIEVMVAGQTSSVCGVLVWMPSRG